MLWYNAHHMAQSLVEISFNIIDLTVHQLSTYDCAVDGGGLCWVLLIEPCSKGLYLSTLLLVDQHLSILLHTRHGYL